MEKSPDLTHTAGARLVSAGRAFNEPVLGAFLPRTEYPKHLYHKTLKPVIALNKDDENKARAEGYGDEYQHQGFPNYKFSRAQDGSMIERVVKTPEEEKTLGPEWVDHPDRLTPMPAKRPALRGTRTPDKGNLNILLDTDGNLKRVVTLDVARRFGGVSRRAIDAAAKKGSLRTEGNR